MVRGRRENERQSVERKVKEREGEWKRQRSEGRGE